MPCVRCTADVPVDKRGWCAECEKAFDGWVRRYASDVIWPLLLGMTLVTSVAVVLPLLGAGTLIIAGGIDLSIGSFMGPGIGRGRPRSPPRLRGRSR